MFNSHFSRKTIARLTKLGITITGLTMLLGTDGSYANGEAAYIVNNNGESQVKTFGQVLALAA